MKTGEPVKATPGEQDLLELLKKHLVDGRLRFLSGIDDEAFDLPPSIQQLLSPAVEELSNGGAVVIASAKAELTPQVAGELLGVSRPYVMRLIKQGDLQTHKVGKHHRVPLEELIAYKAKRDQARRKRLDQLARESQALGLR